MIPLRDLHRPTRPPVVTYSLIALNVAVHLLLLSADDIGQLAIVGRFGLVPALFSLDALTGAQHPGGVPLLLTPLTSLFLHGGLMHLAGNVWFLHVFGDNVEDALGHARFLGFYLLAGLGAALAQVMIDPASTTPMIGASGAISGVLGAYLVLYPRARMLVLVPIFVIVSFFEWPAYFVVGEWFFIQVFAGLVSLTEPGGDGGGVAWFAHIGGFLVGLVSIRVLLPQADEPD